jgi:transcriptional regulator GlxA family with amidase domain
LLGFDGVTALDLIGPIDTFTAATIQEDENLRDCSYQTVIIGLTNKPFTSESGVVFKPRASLGKAPDLDTLMIPGGSGLRNAGTAARVSGWIQPRAKSIRRIASVCTGIYGLAPTGLLNGRRVTTHWRFARDVARRFPRLKMESNALFLKDGPFYTSAGITAGIDLSLALIEEDFGPSLALSTARELVVYLKRPGGQEQYSESLRYQTEATNRFADLTVWIQAHLSQDLSVEALAERACLCSRQFSRVFKEVFGATPAAFVLNLRLDETRRRLALPRQTIESVAAAAGFSSADSFRRAFERRFGVSPSSYRKRFGVTSSHLSIGNKA